MILRTTLASPFGRKVRMAVQRLGLADAVRIADTNYLDPADALRVENPLGKMPVLTTTDGRHIFDSRVILDYLDELSGGGVLLPRSGAARIDALTLQALCDGIMDAGVVIVMEQRLRPVDKRDEAWLGYQRDKMQRGMAALNSSLGDPHEFTVGTIAAACMLGFIDRRQQIAWREPYPSLVDWLERFGNAAPEFAATGVPA